MPETRQKQYQLLFQKASVDLAVVNHLITLNPDDIDREVLLFHLQQAAEKLLKALIARNNIHFEKTHDLIELLELCSSHAIIIPDYTGSFEDLYPYAVQGRYDFLSGAVLDPLTYYKTLIDFKDFVLKQIMAEQTLFVNNELNQPSSPSPTNHGSRIRNS